MTTTNRFTNDTQREQFRRGVGLLMDQWDIMQLVMEHQMAGDDTDTMVDELVNNLIEWLSGDDDSEDPTAQEIEQYITEVLREDMDIDIEHPSIAFVSQQLLQIKARCAAGNYSMVEQLQREAVERLSSSSGGGGAGSGGNTLSSGMAAGLPGISVSVSEFVAEENAARAARLQNAAQRMAALLNDSDSEDEMGENDETHHHEEEEEEEGGAHDGGWTTVGTVTDSSSRRRRGGRGRQQQQQDDDAMMDE